MEICLHLGAHRTASTLFQSYIWDNRATLKSRGTLYWGPKRLRSGLFSGLLGDVDSYASRNKALQQRSLGRVKMEINRATRSGACRLVISDASLLGSLRESFHTNVLYGRARKRLGMMAPAFGGAGLRIGLCVRSYESYWSSALSRRIMSGRAPLGQDDLDRLVTQPRRWRHMVEDIGAVFPEAEIIVWPYEAWAAEPDVLLPALIGEPCAGLKPPQNRPVKPGPSIAQINDAFEVMGKETIDPLFARYMPFDASAAQKLRDDYVEDIRWLRNGADGMADYLRPASEKFGGRTAKARPLETRSKQAAQRGRLHDRGQQSRERSMG